MRSGSYTLPIPDRGCWRAIRILNFSEFRAGTSWRRVARRIRMLLCPPRRQRCSEKYTIYVAKRSVMMVRVPHTSVSRVGVLVWWYAEGVKTLLRACGSAFSDVQLLSAVAAVGNSTGAKCVRRATAEDSGALPISAGRVCGDAGACAPIDQRASGRYAVRGAESIEAARFA